MKHSPKSKTKPKLPNYSFSFDAIGTHWHIELTDTARSSLLEGAIRRRIDQFDALYSRFRADSLITAMAEGAGTYQLPADAQPLFDLYKTLYALTDGAFTPLIGQVLVDAGYDATYSLRPKPLTEPPHWDAVLHYNYPTLTLKKPVLLDVGAAGKGYLVDIIGNLLDDHGAHGYIINAGGDILHHASNKKETTEVALEHPNDSTQAIGVATLANNSICGSSGNRRAWRGMHHIIDPHSLQPVRDITSVWVVADTTMLADALSTCLFFVSPNQLKTTYTFEYALVRSDQSLEYSSGFPATFF
jgi:thiamine biosynthesis lipoprotein